MDRIPTILAAAVRVVAHGRRKTDALLFCSCGTRSTERARQLHGRGTARLLHCSRVHRERFEATTMRWTPGGRSRNLDDLRGQTGGGRMIGGRGMGIGGAVIALILSLV